MRTFEWKGEPLEKRVIVLRTVHLQVFLHLPKSWTFINQTDQLSVVVPMYKD